jgi:ELWxxDGT repeat protein
MSLAYFDEIVGASEQLWVTDGTAAGTHLVQSFGAGAIFDLTTIGSRVYFTIDDGVHGSELWTSDGTAAGTMLVEDIDPGATGSDPGDLTNVNGTLYFEASDGTHG